MKYGCMKPYRSKLGGDIAEVFFGDTSRLALARQGWRSKRLARPLQSRYTDTHVSRDAPNDPAATKGNKPTTGCHGHVGNRIKKFGEQ